MQVKFEVHSLKSEGLSVPCNFDERTLGPSFIWRYQVYKCKLHYTTCSCVCKLTAFIDQIHHCTWLGESSNSCLVPGSIKVVLFQVSAPTRCAAVVPSGGLWPSWSSSSTASPHTTCSRCASRPGSLSRSPWRGRSIMTSWPYMGVIPGRWR